MTHSTQTIIDSIMILSKTQEEDMPRTAALQHQPVVDRHIGLPLGVQQLRQGVEVVLVRPVQIPQLPGGVVPLPRHHEPLLLVLVEVARVELAGGVRVHRRVQPALFLLVDVVFVAIAVQVQSRFETLPGGAVTGRGVLTVVLVQGQDGQDVLGGELDVALYAAVQSVRKKMAI